MAKTGRKTWKFNLKKESQILITDFSRLRVRIVLPKTSQQSYYIAKIVSAPITHILNCKFTLTSTPQLTNKAAEMCSAHRTFRVFHSQSIFKYEQMYRSMFERRLWRWSKRLFIRAIFKRSCEKSTYAIIKWFFCYFNGFLVFRDCLFIWKTFWNKFYGVRWNFNAFLIIKKKIRVLTFLKHTRNSI